MPLHESKKATLADWEALGEDVRAELIDGEIYNMAGPSAAHQRILSFLHIEIGTYLRGKTCEVFTAPFDVYLQHEDE
ncbi:MAG: Uma2 family endonuclease, partial [Clostridia bacterium]